MPTLIERWNEVVGTYAEEYAYEDLKESYLHQGTILSVAYAVVPHLAARLRELDVDRRLDLFEDLAEVEDSRLVSPAELAARERDLRRSILGELLEQFVKNLYDRHPPIPADLAPAYLGAIDDAKKLAGEAWGLEPSQQSSPRHFRRHLRYLRNAGFLDSDIAFGIDALTREGDEGVLLYAGRDEALAGLREVTDQPAGWFERTGLRGDEAHQRLAFSALHSLAWVSRGDWRSALRDLEK